MERRDFDSGLTINEIRSILFSHANAAGLHKVCYDGTMMHQLFFSGILTFQQALLVIGGQEFQEPGPGSGNHLLLNKND
ncbi:MAG: hypothetical protein NUV51_01010 [Sulfuricaulis sp.]|nr:hypothetical protein [Sulfuricaulis sp.]